jgi:hypothetical protein
MNILVTTLGAEAEVSFVVRGDTHVNVANVTMLATVSADLSIVSITSSQNGEVVGDTLLLPNLVAGTAEEITVKVLIADALSDDFTVSLNITAAITESTILDNDQSIQLKDVYSLLYCNDIVSCLFDLNSVQIFDTEQLAREALGTGQLFTWAEDNNDSEPSPNDTNLGVTRAAPIVFRGFESSISGAFYMYYDNALLENVSLPIGSYTIAYNGNSYAVTVINMFAGKGYFEVRTSNPGSFTGPTPIQLTYTRGLDPLQSNDLYDVDNLVVDGLFNEFDPSLVAFALQSSVKNDNQLELTFNENVDPLKVINIVDFTLDFGVNPVVAISSFSVEGNKLIAHFASNIDDLETYSYSGDIEDIYYDSITTIALVTL